MKRWTKGMVIAAAALLTVGTALTATGSMMGAGTVTVNDGKLQINHGNLRFYRDFNDFDDDFDDFDDDFDDFDDDFDDFDDDFDDFRKTDLTQSAGTTSQNSAIAAKGNQDSYNYPDSAKISEIEVTSSIGNFNIVQGEKWNLTYHLSQPEKLENILGNNGKLKIAYRPKGELFDKSKQSFNESITLTVPKGTKLRELDIIGGVGDISIEKLDAASIEISGGVGDVTIKDVNADEFSHEGGVGNFTATNLTSKDFDAQAGVGDIKATGTFTGEVDLEGGVGDIDLICQKAAQEDYDIEIESSKAENIKIGTMTLNGNYESRAGKGKSISVEGGVGEITVRFEK